MVIPGVQFFRIELNPVMRDANLKRFQYKVLEARRKTTQNMFARCPVPGVAKLFYIEHHSLIAYHFISKGVVTTGRVCYQRR